MQLHHIACADAVTCLHRMLDAGERCPSSSCWRGSEGGSFTFLRSPLPVCNCISASRAPVQQQQMSFHIAECTSHSTTTQLHTYALQGLFSRLVSVCDRYVSCRSALQASRQHRL